MILFACARDATLPEIQKFGLRPSGLGHKLYRSLNAARRECSARILVVELSAKELVACTVKDAVVVAPLVGIGSFRNLNPYLAPEDVTAAGGLVTRRRRGRHQILCIHRRGVWDLPKGKVDEGESVEECARREVCEELGIDDVQVLGPAQRTLHGYPRNRMYHVKTTHWFWMRTRATDFTPQAEEGIVEVAWMPWDEAAKNLGYRSLRELLRGLDPADAGP